MPERSGKAAGSFDSILVAEAPFITLRMTRVFRGVHRQRSASKNPVIPSAAQGVLRPQRSRRTSNILLLFDRPKEERTSSQEGQNAVGDWSSFDSFPPRHRALLLTRATRASPRSRAAARSPVFRLSIPSSRLFRVSPVPAVRSRFPRPPTDPASKTLAHRRHLRKGRRPFWTLALPSPPSSADRSRRSRWRRCRMSPTSRSGSS